MKSRYFRWLYQNILGPKIEWNLNNNGFMSTSTQEVQ